MCELCTVLCIYASRHCECSSVSTYQSPCLSLLILIPGQARLLIDLLYIKWDIKRFELALFFFTYWLIWFIFALVLAALLLPLEQWPQTLFSCVLSCCLNFAPAPETCCLHFFLQITFPHIFWSLIFLSEINCSIYQVMLSSLFSVCPSQFHFSSQLVRHWLVVIFCL